MESISVFDEVNGDNIFHDLQIEIYENPENCPLCHRQIMPIRRNVSFNSERDLSIGNDSLQIVFECPHLKCRSIFITSYFEEFGSYHVRGSRPWNSVDEVFSEIIESTSKDFTIIYNQASSAEQQKLDMICGAGYRRALEFLIKDYLIGKNKEQDGEIKKSLLGTLIEQKIDNQKIKIVAKRAVWLGNDETHYTRRWGSKDVQDLKMLIDLTVKWIEMEKLTEKLLEDMPENK